MPDAADTPTTESPSGGWRAEQFMDLGFNEIEASLLASTRDSAGWLVSIHSVRRAIDGGCSHALALRIYL